jgi:hypothetical protein
MELTYYPYRKELEWRRPTRSLDRRIIVLESTVLMGHSHPTITEIKFTLRFNGDIHPVTFYSATNYAEMIADALRWPDFGVLRMEKWTVKVNGLSRSTTEVTGHPAEFSDQDRAEIAIACMSEGLTYEFLERAYE